MGQCMGILGTLHEEQQGSEGCGDWEIIPWGSMKESGERSELGGITDGGDNVNLRKQKPLRCGM